MYTKIEYINVRSTFFSDENYKTYFNEEVDPHHFFINENYKITSTCEHLSKIMAYSYSYRKDELIDSDARLLFADNFDIIAPMMLLKNSNEFTSKEIELKTKRGHKFWVFAHFKYEIHPTRYRQRQLLCQFIDIDEYKKVKLNINTPKQKAVKQKILFLSANPVDTGGNLRLGEELRKLKDILDSSSYRDKFDLIGEPAVRIGTITKAMQRHRPKIVHFSGHGNSEDIVTEDITGNSSYFSTNRINRLSKLFRKEVKCVVLNACYSATIAKSISENGIYVVGMNESIDDKSAINFTRGFLSKYWRR